MENDITMDKMIGLFCLPSSVLFLKTPKIQGMSSPCNGNHFSSYYYYESIARNDGFSRAPEIDFRYETKARKVMVDFKFDALYSKVFMKSLLKSG